MPGMQRAPGERPLGRDPRSRTWRLYVDLVSLGRENKIVLVEPSDLVRPAFHPDLAPGEVDVGVVLLALGELTHSGGELHRLAEVLERVRPLDTCDPSH